MMATTEIIAEPGVPFIETSREFGAPRELLFRAQAHISAGPLPSGPMSSWRWNWAAIIHLSCGTAPKKPLPWRSSPPL